MLQKLMIPLALFAPALQLQAQEAVIVTLNRVDLRHGLKVIVLQSDKATYMVNCVIEQESCLTPVVGRSYYLIDKQTKLVLQGAKEPITLEFLENWSGSYKNAENVSLVPSGVNWRGTSPSMYRLTSITSRRRQQQ